MSPSFAAIVPVFLVIVLGALFRWRRWLPDSFWAPAEWLTYYVTFPALLIANLSGASLDGVPWPALMAVEACAVLACAGLLLGARPWLFQAHGVSARAFTSVFQGGIRPNTYIGLAVASALFGAQGVTLTAICVAVVVPLVNVLAVACMVRFGHAQKASVAGLLRGIASNPLIIACAIGIALNASGIGAPPFIGPFMTLLAAAALPLGLLAVGAGLDLKALRGASWPLIVSSFGKMILTPALIALGGLAVGLDRVTLAVAVLYGALPCSASAYVLARKMGGDAPLMAAIITGQTVLAALVLPGVLGLFQP